jgi:hypothetical protein
MIHRNTGRPRTSHTDENCVIVEGLIKDDRIVKVHEISEVTGIAKGAVHEISSNLKAHKVSARWVPKILTEEQ